MFLEAQRNFAEVGFASPLVHRRWPQAPVSGGERAMPPPMPSRGSGMPSIFCRGLAIKPAADPR